MPDSVVTANGMMALVGIAEIAAGVTTLVLLIAAVQC
jgi:hypothetical protein